jgi:hypothetical protein
MPKSIRVEQASTWIFMPSLLRLFREAEQQGGAPLTLEQARSIRAKATGMLVTKAAAQDIEIRRGFRDLHPDDFWNEWQGPIERPVPGAKAG